MDHGVFNSTLCIYAIIIVRQSNTIWDIAAAVTDSEKRQKEVEHAGSSEQIEDLLSQDAIVSDDNQVKERKEKKKSLCSGEQDQLRK